MDSRDISRLRIIEWVDQNQNNSCVVAYELQFENQNGNWYSLEMLPTLAAAQSALLFHMPINLCGLS